MAMTPEQYAALFNPPPTPPPQPQVPQGPPAELTLTPAGTEDSPEWSVEDEIFLGYKRKFVKEEWQDVDISHLLKYDGTENGQDDPEQPPPTNGTANWSEMGCYKTSTGLWYLERK